MNDLLKEAIADAKAVRETALANAKIALEEAFTPRIQSMLSAKLAEDTYEDEDEVNAGYIPEEDGEEIPAEEIPAEEEFPVADGYVAEDDFAAEEETIEEPIGDGYVAEEDDLNLEDIIRELEGDLNEDEGSEEVAAEDEKAAATPEPADESIDEDADFDINEIIAALNEEGDDVEDLEEDQYTAGVCDKGPALEEAYNVIKFMKDKLNEVNLLNAKLLFSNKLFRNFDLNENQKLKVIDNFDRAFNLREVKLIYATLCESFNVRKKKALAESYASKPMRSTKPSKKIINESSELANRFKQLAFGNRH